MFLSLYGLIIMPWLAGNAPQLVTASAPLPAGFVVAFLTCLMFWCLGAVLLGSSLIHGRTEPRWVGYVLIASALWMLLGNLVLARSGPATNVLVNLLSNLGPVLLLGALARLGTGMRWNVPPSHRHAPA